MVPQAPGKWSVTLKALAWGEAWGRGGGGDTDEGVGWELLIDKRDSWAVPDCHRVGHSAYKPFIVLLGNLKMSCVVREPEAVCVFFFSLRGSRAESSCWMGSSQHGQTCSFTVDVSATLLSLVHPRPPVSNLVGKDLFLGPCNLAMGSHDQWQLQAEYTVGSRLLAGGVGQTWGGGRAEKE